MAEITTELDLLIEERRLQKAVADAKAAVEAAIGDRYRSSREVRADPAVAAANEALNAVKLEHREFRRVWREVRRAQLDAAIAGDPEALQRFKDELGEGGAIAAPAPVEMTTQAEG